jgi:hypothetical protein
VQVYFRPDDSGLSTASFYTDAGGRYLAQGLAAGSYKIRAKIDNWAAQYYSGKQTYALAAASTSRRARSPAGSTFCLPRGEALRDAW